VINGKRFLGIIPARGGSKGVPGKNIRPVGGKPLIAWTIEAARSSKYLDRVVLSSDDASIASIALAHTCEVPFIREPNLATDTASTIDVVLDALTRCPGYEWVVLLQPTSPLRSADDIDRAIEQCLELGAPACVSVCLARESPYWMFNVGQTARLTPLLPDVKATRRQDLPSAYSLNGAIYVAEVDWLSRERRFVTSETVAYVMPAERSIDIDTETDFLILKFLLGD
jgi:N-acylneuraminate cytidylyltransferase